MSKKFTHSWEEAVEWLRQNDDKKDLVQHCYYDDPIDIAAARYFRSEEWREVTRLLGKALPGRILDIGAGRGISSYAFARCGCDITALEPYPSASVGVEAIRTLVEMSGVAIDIIQESGESIPFPDSTFDVVYCRAALHHAIDLDKLCSEMARVLKKSGVCLATREHVLSSRDDLDRFLENHPLHHLYGGENAYTLREYKKAFYDAGLKLVNVIGPFDSVVNYAPMTRREWESRVRAFLSRRFGDGLGLKLSRSQFIHALVSRFFSLKSNTPGRLYSFLAEL